MPTYEYTCSKCQHEFEVVQSMSDKPLSLCPESLCKFERWGRGKVKRRISAGAGLIFKGSGFYITDYRSEGYQQAAKRESEAAAPKKESSTTPKDNASKPAKTEKSKPSPS